MFVVINSAISVDGKICTKTGESKISSDLDLKRVHKLRCSVDGILVGISTVLKDDPLLSIRLIKCTKAKKTPTRIIIDSNARIPLDSKIVKTAKDIDTVIAVTKGAPRDKLDMLRANNLRIIVSGEQGKKVNLDKAFGQLETKFGIKKILVEGGGEINWSIIKNNLFDEIIVTISPLIIGGRDATTLTEGIGFDKIKKCVKLELSKIHKSNNGEIVVHYNNIGK
ncbi:MAG: 2,5-diamino-6-(ribosylamino)-4(3H)-pyrimidinone 5'-phosphate reductase [Nitrosopumilus sp.]|nr:2,5-diamino-6-(ribosylamino)-4(3H)-pyrimidinone 5'-phosphate reductase [Nitrosopumilus sp.]